MKQLVDDVIAAEFGAPDLEFRWKDDQAGDPAAVAQVAADYVKTGIKSVNEVRAELGLDPVAGGDAPMILTAQGPVPLGARAAGEPLARYNQNHYGPGPQGGQFAPRGEGGGTGSGATRVSATSGGSGAKPWVGKPHQKFREKIASLETGGQPNDGYGTSVKEGGAGPALGRYQLTVSALKDAGWIDKNTGAWNPASGITSNQQFLNDPEAQERAMTDALSAYEQKIKEYGLDSEIGRTYAGQKDEIAVTLPGLVAAANREGAKAVAEYFDALKSFGGSTQAASLSIKQQAVETRLRTFQNVPY